MDEKIVNNIKSLGIDMIQNAKSGHPGIVLSSANIMYTLFSKHLNINPNDPKWINRDRFILSAGHGSSLLYATLFMAGYLELEDLKNFRKIDSKTPGHPEIPLADCSTGQLGQGFATAVGMALASKKLNKEITKPKEKFYGTDQSLIDYKVYVLVSDGDIMEGVTQEAASIAGNLNLDNLIVLYDSNNMTLDNNTNITLKEDVLLKFKAMNWDTISVKNNINAIDKAISKAKTNSNPTIIEVKTILGEGSIIENTNNVHGGPLQENDVKQLKQKLRVVETPFYFSKEAKDEFQKQIFNHMSIAYQKWSDNYRSFKNNEIINNIEDYDFIFNNNQKYNLLDYDFNFTEEKESLRESNSRIIKVLGKNIPNFIGGSADLATKTGSIIESDFISSNNYKGKNIAYGIREGAMASISNGLALSSYKPFASTFLNFADYMKPGIRMSALMNLNVNYIFTNDSVSIGEDGPTHQPIEQLDMLRSIPNLDVYRPCDFNELVGSWNNMLNSENPNALVLTKQEVNNLENSRKDLVQKGAYIIQKEIERVDAIFIATGSEVHTAISLARSLREKYSLDIRIVSMPSIEIFEKQSKEYKNEILPLAKTFTIEASTSYKIAKYASNSHFVISINNFGKSGSKDEVLRYLNFDFESIEKRIVDTLRQVY